MGGLVAAARARQLGLEPSLLEKGAAPGGSMRWSSGVVWRHPTAEAFRAECPRGDPALQELIVTRLDDALDWLETIGAPVTARATGNPRTIGRRFDPGGLAAALVRAAGEPLLRADVTAAGGAADAPLVLATGGFGARLAAERRLLVRGNPHSDGAGIALARSRGAALTGGQDEFYGRALPAPPARVPPEDWVRAAQLYGRVAHRVDREGRPFFQGEPTWSETDLVQALAGLRGGEGWYVLDTAALAEPVRERRVADLVGVAEELGGEVRRASTLEGLRLGDLRSPFLREPPFTAVCVRAAVTHTLGGVRVDTSARVLDADARPLARRWACGADAGGIFTGGYGSGLAAALVLGLAAAEDAAATL